MHHIEPVHQLLVPCKHPNLLWKVWVIQAANFGKQFKNWNCEGMFCMNGVECSTLVSYTSSGNKSASAPRMHQLFQVKMSSLQEVSYPVSILKHRMTVTEWFRSRWNWCSNPFFIAKRHITMYQLSIALGCLFLASKLIFGYETSQSHVNVLKGTLSSGSNICLIIWKGHIIVDKIRHCPKIPTSA